MLTLTQVTPACDHDGEASSNRIIYRSRTMSPKAISIVTASALWLIPVLGWAAKPHPAPPPPAPPRSTLQQIIDQSSAIAVAQLPKDLPQSGQYLKAVDLEILEVIKGDLKPGKHAVALQRRTFFEPSNDQFVVFLGKKNAWEYKASPMGKDGSVSKGILRVDRCDGEAHYVDNAVITMEKVRSYLKDRTLSYVIRGQVFFPKKGQSGWEASKIEVQLTYDASKPFKGEMVRGLPKMKGMATDPTFALTPKSEQVCVRLYYEHGAARLPKDASPAKQPPGVPPPVPPTPFELIGKVQKIDEKTGTWLTNFYPQEPWFLSQRDFENYLGDPTKGRCWYTIKLTCVSTQDSVKIPNLTVTVKPQGMTIAGWSKQPLAVWREEVRDSQGRTSTNYPEAMPAWLEKDWSRYSPGLVAFATVDKEANLVVLFDAGKDVEADVEFSSNYDGLLRRLTMKDSSGKLYLSKGKAGKQVGTFTAALEGVFYETTEKK